MTTLPNQIINIKYKYYYTLLQLYTIIFQINLFYWQPDKKMLLDTPLAYYSCMKLWLKQLFISTSSSYRAASSLTHKSKSVCF